MFERWSQKGLMLYQVGYRIRTADTKETEPLLAGTLVRGFRVSNLNTVPFFLFFSFFSYFPSVVPSLNGSLITVMVTLSGEVRVIRIGRKREKSDNKNNKRRKRSHYSDCTASGKSGRSFLQECSP